jgi:hypothetical protein
LGETLLNPLRKALVEGGGGGARGLPRLVGSKLGSKLDDVASLMAVIDAFKNRPE